MKPIKPIKTFVGEDGSWNIQFKSKDIKRLLKHIKKNTKQN